ncbi:MAG: aspartate dehydrogenase [Candidatus Omnitrophota bacterium]|nr:MAG: aspartate dehydrogenase [Candidatus Omnitrophota bacterium]
MEKKLKIGIVGCGAIGSTLAEAIRENLSKGAELASLYDTDLGKCYKLANISGNKKLAALNLDALINKANLVIEATKAASAFEIAKKCLAFSKDIMIMSVGGIIEHYKELELLAKGKKAKIYIPSGAVCGIDGLKALANSRINKVTLTTKKPPKAFLGASYISKRKIRLDNLKEDTVIFEGDAYSAIRVLPQNVNVAATLSIAGIGPKDTVIRIVASPEVTRNVHEIEIEAEAGKIVARTENIAHPDNPKTSYLAALSAIAYLKQIIGSLKVGT